MSVLHYREQGYLPEAMNNYLARLGWSHKDQEIFSPQELIRYFDLDHVSHAPAAFNIEKLAWLNQHYIKTMDPQDLVPPLIDQMQSHGVDYKNGPSLSVIINLQAERIKTLGEMVERSRYFFEEVIQYDEKAARKYLKPAILSGLLAMQEKMVALNDWNKEALHRVIIEVAQSLDLKLGQLAQPLRVAVTGTTMSPSMDMTLECIGRARVLVRLNRAIDWIRALK